MKYLINLSYNGSKYYGYQIQKNKITVEGQIEKVLSKIFNGNINTLGTSRTDKGVHANNQYCVFEVNKDINTRNLTHSMNSMLDDYIYIKKIVKVNDEFNIRNVTRKEYIYKINMGEYNPIEAEYTFQYCKNIQTLTVNFNGRLLRESMYFAQYCDNLQTVNLKFPQALTIHDYYETGVAYYDMFRYCGNLNYVNLNMTSLNATNARADFGGMFYQTAHIKEIHGLDLTYLKPYQKPLTKPL